MHRKLPRKWIHQHLHSPPVSGSKGQAPERLTPEQKGHIANRPSAAILDHEEGRVLMLSPLRERRRLADFSTPPQPPPLFKAETRPLTIFRRVSQLADAAHRPGLTAASPPQRRKMTQQPAWITCLIRSRGIEFLGRNVAQKSRRQPPTSSTQETQPENERISDSEEEEILFCNNQEVPGQPLP